jgi:phospholipid transport system substrate-binding protein
VLVRRAIAGLVLIAGSALAQTLPPDVLVARLSAEVISALQQEDGDPARVSAMVELVIAPHVDFMRVAQVVVGPACRSATREQQSELTRELQRFLARKYTAALASYRDHTVQVMPAHANARDDQVTVRTFLGQVGPDSVEVDYELERTPAGWQVYDLRLGGFSVAAAYRNWFGEELRERGIDGLIAVLTAKNAEGSIKAALR